MDSLPGLTEVDIRERATDASFDRGYEYYRDGAVLEIEFRGNQVAAEVEGSDYDPYQVSISLSEHGIEYAACTCPYDWGGDCKHIVAVLLTYIHSPEEMEELPSVEAMLTDLDRDQLQALILKLVNSQPGLANMIHRQLLSMQVEGDEADVESAAPSPRERQRPLDPEPFRRQVRYVLHSLDYMSSSEAYWHVGGVANSVLEILEQARTFMEANDGRNALTILKAVTEEYVSGWTFLDDSDGELGELFDRFDLLWTEAILLADLTPAERGELSSQLDDWDAEVSDYGIDDAFMGAYEAIQQGWDSPILQSILNGEDIDLGEWYMNPMHSELAGARLNILARQERTQEYLNLAKVERRTESYTTMLVQLGRVQEAVDYGMEYMGLTDEALTLAKALHDRGETELALEVAEHGLKLGGEYSELARWLRDIAS
ncbi:SWIM zinc finger domain-containing protein, partial [Candidatus Poribacteria bacterium]